MPTILQNPIQKNDNKRESEPGRRIWLKAVESTINRGGTERGLKRRPAILEKAIKVQNQMGGSERGSKLPAREARREKQTPEPIARSAPGCFEPDTPSERGSKRPRRGRRKSIKLRNQLECMERWGSTPRRRIW